MEEIFGICIAMLIERGNVHGMDISAPSPYFVSSMTYDYRRIMFPIKHVQEVIHVNGQPKIRDLIVVERKRFEQ